MEEKKKLDNALNYVESLSDEDHVLSSNVKAIETSKTEAAFQTAVIRAFQSVKGN